MAIGIALIAVAVLALQVPYRILRHNAFPRVSFADERCYVIGERERESLLFCPDGEVPRNKVVAADDPRLERTTQVENIFTPRAAGARDR